MLEKRLIEYSNQDVYPFHMPGHKQSLCLDVDPYQIDITEITDFDDLHHAEGILKEAQDRAAQLYNAKSCYYLINGSTCGILAAISAATKKGDKVLVARNCHKAVYHALYLRELIPVYVYPQITDYNIQGQILADDIQKALAENSDIKAVIITSPTYDGLVSDIKTIAEIAHSRNIPLIVDEAHGAHFGLARSMPENAISQGADYVIVSIHKTLPAFTQTALLLTNGNIADERKIEKFLDIYETSSPSYLLMAGMDRCIRIMAEQKDELFAKLDTNLDRFYDNVNQLKNIKVLTKSCFSSKDMNDFDKTKIIVATSKSDINGHELKSLLREKYKIELEMSAENYALAIATVMDTEEGLNRLAEALIAIDMDCEGRQNEADYMTNIYSGQNRKLEIHEADDYEQSQLPLEEAVNKVSADYIYFYPPGIPILVPGEIITEKNICDIRHALSLGRQVYGLTENQMIFILKG